MSSETELFSKPAYPLTAATHRPGAEYPLADAFHNQPDPADPAETSLLAELSYLYWLASDR